MDKKTLFNEALTSLVDFASANGNQVTLDDIKVYFSNIIEDENQYKFILEYLNSCKIKVEGFDNADFSTASPSNGLESEEELAFIEMYMSELDSIVPASQEELNTLLEKHISGDSSVDDRIIECNLTLVATIAKDYTGQGVTMGDLIQEGNIGLIMGLSRYDNINENFNNFITKSIKDALDNVVNDQINSSRVGDHLANKLNRLDEVTKDLSEKLGRVPEIEELAQALNISKDEVETLLKTSLDTLSVNEDTQIMEQEEEMDVNNLFTPNDDPLDWKYSKKN